MLFQTLIFLAIASVITCAPKQISLNTSLPYTLHLSQNTDKATLEKHVQKHQKKSYRLINDELLERLRRQRQHNVYDGFESSPFQRKPPRIPNNNPSDNGHLFTDQTEYVHLGDQVGTVIAVGDFTADRYSDLLVAFDTLHPRCIAVLPWDHFSYSFLDIGSIHPSFSKSSSFSSLFCIDLIPTISSNAFIASAFTIDANADGFLDVLLSVRRWKTKHIGCILLGDGTGKLAFDQIISDVNPHSLVMDANDDMHADIFVITPKGERMFYINDPPGIFTKHIWQPYPLYNSSSQSLFSSSNLQEHCKPTYPFNSNAFVDINGDCLPDLIVTTKCGMEVWMNHVAHEPSSNFWLNGHFSGKPVCNFHHLQLPEHEDAYIILNRSVWDFDKDDSHAAFFDFNADGAIDIAVVNTELRSVRISYNVRRSRVDGRLCSGDGPLRFLTRTVLRDVLISPTNFGPTVVPPMLRVGDFNYDGLADLLFVDRDSGTVSLYSATSVSESHSGWLERSTWESDIIAHPPFLQNQPFLFCQWILLALTGKKKEFTKRSIDTLRYTRFTESSVLQSVEDPLAAAFFDLDESGRQDIIVPQKRGTRLIWNNLEHSNDLVYFKATGVNSARPPKSLGFSKLYPEPSGIHAGRSSCYSQPFSPLPGNTFKISYSGRYRAETQVCTQCPQSSVLTLQSCSCLFGITRVANYIEEMTMGGAGFVRSWSALMPNALAVIWPQYPPNSGGVINWKVSYLSRGRDGQLKRIVFVLCVTLAVLLVVILYMHNGEQIENRVSQRTLHPRLFIKY